MERGGYGRTFNSMHRYGQVNSAKMPRIAVLEGVAT